MGMRGSRFPSNDFSAMTEGRMGIWLSTRSRLRWSNPSTDLTGQALIHRSERIFLDEITDAEDVNIRIFFPAMLHSPGVKPQIQKIAYFL